MTTLAIINPATDGTNADEANRTCESMGMDGFSVE
jgi:hypothetical protein